MRRNATEESRRLAHGYFLRGYKAQMRGRYQDALKLYERSLEAHATAAAHMLMGWTYSFLDRYEEAIDCCRNAIRIDPTLGNPYNDIGAYLLELGRGTEAIPWLLRALDAERYESCHFAYFNLGRAHEQVCDPIEAERCYRMALETNPHYRLARQALRRLAARRN